VLFLVSCCLLRMSLFLGFVFLFFVCSICVPVLKPPSSVTAAVFWHWLVHRSHLLRRSFSWSCSRSGKQLLVLPHRGQDTGQLLPFSVKRHPDSQPSLLSGSVSAPRNSFPVSCSPSDSSVSAPVKSCPRPGLR
jgi:hypothetical protein